MVAFFTLDATLMFPDSDYIQGEPGIVTNASLFFIHSGINKDYQ